MHSGHKEILKVILVVVVILILVVLVIFGIRRWIITDTNQANLLNRNAALKTGYSSAKAAKQARLAAVQNYFAPPPPVDDTQVASS